VACHLTFIDDLNVVGARFVVIGHVYVANIELLKRLIYLQRM